MLETRAEQPQTTKNTENPGSAPRRSAEPRKPETRTCPALHAVAASLSFRATARDHSGAALGVLVDGAGSQQHLGVTPDGAWSLSGGKAPAGSAVLLYESAANVLRGGAVNAEGIISYAGGDYLIDLSVDGRLRTARLGNPARAARSV